MSDLLNHASRGDAEGVLAHLRTQRPDTLQASLALAAACANGHASIVQLLLPLADPWHEQINWAMPQASQQGHLDTLLLLLNARQSRAEWPTAYDCLGAACIAGKIEWVRPLLDLINPEDGQPSHALVQATKKGHVDIVGLLLKTCPSMAEDQKALAAAALGGDTAITALLLPPSTSKHPLPSSLFSEVAESGFEAVVETLLLASPSQDDITQALSGALYNEHRGVVDILLPRSNLARVLNHDQHPEWFWERLDQHIVTLPLSTVGPLLENSPSSAVHLPRSRALLLADALRTSLDADIRSPSPRTPRL